MRQKVVEAARAWLGLRESDGSFRQIIDVYNTITPLPRGYRMTYSDAWCAAFVSAVAQGCGLTSIIYPECGCDPMIQLYKNHDRWQEDDSYLPDPGDIVFYDWQDSGTGDNKGGADHVGIVCAVNGNTIKVIEGNKSDAVGYRTINRNERYIRGFGLPDYAEEDDKGDQGEETLSSLCTFTATLPVLRYGAIGWPVKVMQTALVGKGFSVGWMGTDGEYGEKTGKGLKQFQTFRGLEADGICGPKTWEKLLGVN